MQHEEKGKIDPFADRLSRDIRNDLSSALAQSMSKGDMTPVRTVASAYLNQVPGTDYEGYILNRVAKYERVLKKVSQGKHDTMQQALVLWDLQLFFEMHEVLEHAWLQAEGEEKLIFQAMIRAAGVYIKLESGYPGAAGKIAGKAIPVLEKYRNYLATYFKPEILLHSLKDLTLPPPLLID